MFFLKIKYSDVSVNSDDVILQMFRYMSYVSRYNNFDFNQMIRIFCNSDGDFTAFESIMHRIQFTSNRHKLRETIMSNKIVENCKFIEWYKYITELAFERNIDLPLENGAVVTA